MSQPTFYNIVLFRSGTTASAPAAALTLDRPWKLSAGLKPDINQATLPAPEFQKIADVNATGQVEFYFTNSPPAAGAAGSADLIIANVRIVDIEPMTLSQYIPSGTTTITTGYAEYRLSFADFRESFQAPRGGRLYYGPINTSAAGKPTGSTSSTTTTATSPELTTVQLVTLCLQNMGLDGPPGGWPSGNWGNLPASLNQTAAPRNLKWFGNHAGQELEKLLTAAGHAFCPHLDGTWTVEPITASGIPAWGSPPSGGGTYAKLPTGTAAKIDQRGRYVAITSAPTRAINTETISGPGSESAGGGPASGGDFEFVVWSTSFKAWVEIGGFYGDSGTAGKVFYAWVNGGTAGLQQLAAGQGGATLPPLPSDALDPKVVSQIFSFVQVADSVIGSHTLSPILGSRFEADGSEQPIAIIANGAAIASSGGSWNNSSQPLSFTASHRLAGNVLALNAPAFSVDGSGNFQELAAGSMTIRLSIEQYQKNQNTDPSQPPLLPFYYFAGFSASASGAPTQLDQDSTQAILTGATKGGLIIDRPEMQLLIVDGQEVNRGALDAVAATIAGAYLKSGGQRTEQAVIGLAPIQPSGVVSAVEWDQKAVKTTAHVADYYTAAASVGIHELRRSEGGTGSGQAASEAHPHEATTQSRRQSLGASGDSPASLPLMPAQTPPSNGSSVSLVWATSTISGGEYMGMAWTQPSVPVSAAGLSLNFSGNSGVSGVAMQGTPCVIINALENNRTTNNLPLQKVVLGLRGQVQPASASGGSGTGGLPTYFVQWDPDAIRDIGWDSVNHLLRDATVADPQVADWKTIVQFVNCNAGGGGS